ncbi:MAG: hypothetical protein HQL48_08220, partial [Gammaproteobacteria bacterium]|nr:hypothetical protein [Gammaproteobacteria bacterium]
MALGSRIYDESFETTGQVPGRYGQGEVLYSLGAKTGDFGFSDANGQLSNYSVSFWLNANIAPRDTLTPIYLLNDQIPGSGSATGRQLAIGLQNGQVILSTSTAATAAELPADWVHVTYLSRQGRLPGTFTQHLYLNGVEVATTPVQAISITPGVGYAFEPGEWVVMDELYLFNKSLSGSEVFTVFEFEPTIIQLTELPEQILESQSDFSYKIELNTPSESDISVSIQVIKPELFVGEFEDESEYFTSSAVITVTIPAGVIELSLSEAIFLQSERDYYQSEYDSVSLRLIGTTDANATIIDNYHEVPVIDDINPVTLRLVDDAGTFAQLNYPTVQPFIVNLASDKRITIPAGSTRGELDGLAEASDTIDSVENSLFEEVTILNPPYDYSIHSNLQSHLKFDGEHHDSVMDGEFGFIYSPRNRAIHINSDQSASTLNLPVTYQDEFSLTFWLKTRDDNGEIFSSSAGWGVQLTADGNGYGRLSVNGELTSNTIVNDGKWIFVAVTGNRWSGVRIATDVYVSDRVPLSAGQFTTDSIHTLGNLVGGFDGYLDELRFYDRELTHDELMAVKYYDSYDHPELNPDLFKGQIADYEFEGNLLNGVSTINVLQPSQPDLAMSYDEKNGRYAAALYTNQSYITDIPFIVEDIASTVAFWVKPPQPDWTTDVIQIVNGSNQIISSIGLQASSLNVKLLDESNQVFETVIATSIRNSEWNYVVLS